MFQKLTTFLKGSARWKIEGLNLNRLIGLLLAEKVCLYDVKRPAHRVLEFATAGRRARRAVIAIAAKLCYTVRSQESRGRSRARGRGGETAQFTGSEPMGAANGGGCSRVAESGKTGYAANGGGRSRVAESGKSGYAANGGGRSRVAVSGKSGYTANGGERSVTAESGKTDYTVTVLGQSGLARTLAGLKIRAGLLAGFLLCAAAVAAYSSFIRGIRIEGNERIPDAEISALLDEAHVRPGVLKNAVDLRGVALKLNAALADAASVTARIKGVYLVIAVNETADAPPLAGDRPRDLKADRDGIVTRVFAIAGTPQVKAGDTVRKGRTLIAGYTLDAEGRMAECRAEGEVFARVWTVADRIFFKERTVYARTGRSFTVSDTAMLGFTMKGKGGPPFALYESSTFQTALNRNFFVPVYRISTVYYELEERAEAADFEAEREALAAEVRAEAEMKAGGSERLSVAADARDAGAYYVVSYSIEAEMRIHAL
ncbi:MAG: sporulation protein YqfD [Clostridiales bacterium]|jgi:sporulation protein YqfD|nr:sporulation protein YqfD [Clostridiales bacterium]